MVIKLFIILRYGKQCLTFFFDSLDTQTGHWFYSNTLNGQSTWHHPLEEIHRNLAKEFFSSQTILGAGKLESICKNSIQLS